MPVRCAHVAELADALDSGSSPRKRVQVRLLSWAPSSLVHLFSLAVIHEEVTASLEGS